VVGSPDFLAGSDVDDQSPELQELENPEGEMHLRFYLPSGRELALPAVIIREVSEPSPDRITPVPNVSPLLLGTLNIRGQVIWVVDLGQFLGENVPLNTDRAEVPVIAIEEGDMMLGLAVARVAGMYWLKPDHIESLSNIDDPIREFLRGEWRLNNNRILQLLDHVAILRANRLGQSTG